jgi:hypothetical protein
MDATLTAGGDFMPGHTVELHSLTRVELNGTRGVCRAFDANAGRWEVTSMSLSHNEARRRLLVRPINLRTVTSGRTDAMRALCESLRERYPQRGFKIHPALSFEVDGGGGICIRTTADVAVGEILLVVPEDVGVSTRLAACSTELTLPTGTSMRRVLDDVARMWDARSRNHDCRIIALSDAQLAVLAMHVACRPDNELHARVAAAWPSMEDLRDQLPLLWTVDRLDRIRGTQASRLIERVRNEVDAVFEHVIEPALGGASSLAELFRKEGATLRDSFLFGFSIAFSRAHESSGDCSVGTLRPLIDAINGLPGPHFAAINVEVNGGKWPFLRGNVFRNECNLNVSAVAATRPLRAGEELIIDYDGACSTSAFLLRYGVVPRQLLPNGNSTVDTVECFLPPDLKPPPSDVLRLRAVRDIFGYTGFETGEGFELPTRDLGEVQRGGEPDSLKCIRQLCVLLIAQDHEINAFCDCNGSRFRFNFNSASLGRVFARVFDHNLELLAPLEDEDVVRDIERRGLRAWREAVSAKYGYDEPRPLWAVITALAVG